MKPQNRLEGYVRAQVGNYDDRRLEGAINLPIVSDKVLFRAAGEIGRRDGYTKDVGPIHEGKDYDNLAYESFRVGLTLRPTNRIEIYTVARHYNSHTNGGGTVLGAFNPAAGFDASAFGLGFLPVLAFYPGMATAVAEQEDRGPRRVAYDLDQFSKTRYSQIINQASFELNDNLTLKNIISFSKLKTIYGYDYDATVNPLAGQTSNVNPANPGLFDSGQVPTLAPKVFTEELQLQGTAFDKGLTFSVGGFLDRTKTDLPAGIAEYTFFPFGTVVPTVSAIFDSRNDSEAVFGQATLDVGRFSPSLAGLSITGGLRYTWERSFTSQTIGAPPASEGTFKDNYLSYTATIDYDVSKDVHVYVTARDAYKSGGVNGPIPADSEFRTFPSERLSDVEVGLKSKFTLGTVRGRFNVAAYRGIYDDIQRTTVEPVETPLGVALLNVTRSAAKGKIKGVEINSAIVPVTGLTLNASYSYIDGRYTKVAEGNASEILAGSPFPYTPKHKFSLGATYETSLGTTGDLALGVNYAHQSKSSTAQTNTSFYRYLPGYGLLNASLDLRNVGGRPLDVGVFATNLTDKTTPVGVADFYAGGPGVVGLTYNEPRMYGLRIGYRFGR
jgi:iron complex outermembrane receptor protein